MKFYVYKRGNERSECHTNKIDGKNQPAGDDLYFLEKSNGVYCGFHFELLKFVVLVVVVVMLVLLLT